jgi:hypothetical protein
MTMYEVEQFLNGDCWVKYDGEVYYFGWITDDDELVMLNINNDSWHDVWDWRRELKYSGLYRAVNITDIPQGWYSKDYETFEDYLGEVGIDYEIDDDGGYILI